MRGIYVLASVLLATVLCGCSALGQFTAQDAANAAAIDPAHAACYQAIGAVGTAVGGVTKDTGILTIVATKIAGRTALESAACAPVEAQVLGDLLKATPAAPLVP